MESAYGPEAKERHLFWYLSSNSTFAIENFKIHLTTIQSGKLEEAYSVYPPKGYKLIDRQQHSEFQETTTYISPHFPLPPNKTVLSKFYMSCNKPAFMKLPIWELNEYREWLIGCVFLISVALLFLTPFIFAFTTRNPFVFVRASNDSFPPISNEFGFISYLIIKNRKLIPVVTILDLFIRDYVHLTDKTISVVQNAKSGTDPLQFLLKNRLSNVRFENLNETSNELIIPLSNYFLKRLKEKGVIQFTKDEANYYLNLILILQLAVVASIIYFKEYSVYYILEVFPQYSNEVNLYFNFPYLAIAPVILVLIWFILRKRANVLGLKGGQLIAIWDHYLKRSNFEKLRKDHPLYSLPLLIASRGVGAVNKEYISEWARELPKNTRLAEILVETLIKL